MSTTQAGLPYPNTLNLSNFFNSAAQAFYRAYQPTWYYYRLGQLNLKIGLAGKLLEKNVLSPLSLFPPDSRPLAATILAWDDSLQNSNFPPPPWAGQYVYTPRGDLRGYQDPNFAVAYNYEARSLSMWDRQNQTGLYWTPDADQLPGYEWAAPMRTLWHWLGLQHGLQLAHAAAVGIDNYGVLLAGKGGSGKSTTALACWHAGLQFVSDDYCWVSPQPQATAYSIYRSARILKNSSVKLPTVPIQEHWTQDKLAFNLAQIKPDSISTSLILKAILLPRVSNCHSPRIHPASQQAGLAALGLTTLGQLAQAGPQSLDILKQLAQQLPSYYLDLCPPASQVASEIEKFILKEL